MKRTNEWYRKKCVAKAKKKAKERDGYKCQHCGRTKEQGWQIHASHIYNEGIYKGMSADEDNIIALCVNCHTGGMSGRSGKSWHGDPMYYSEWFKNKYPELEKKLRLRSQQLEHSINWETRYLLKDNSVV